MEKTRTTTKKVVKRRLKWKGVLFLTLVVLGLYWAVKEFIKVDISAIKVTGNEYIKDSQVIKLAGLNDKVAYFGFSSNAACNGVMEEPLIKSCKIKRGLSFKIEIIVQENKPLFFYAPESATVLSDGSRIEGTNLYGLPTLINFVPEDILAKFMSGLSDIDNDIIRSIGEIEYSPTTSENGTYIDKERFVFDMNDENTVIINNRNMSIFNHYKTIYSSIDKKGIFEFDCDYDNYIFTEYGE